MLKNHSLSESLRQTWEKYEKQVHLSRNKTSTRNIHHLRISTQRLEAILTLVNSLHSTHHSKNIISLIKDVRRSLGPLRDIQVESIALEKMTDQKLNSSKASQFSKFLARHKDKAENKAVKSLKEISLKHEKDQITKLVKKLVRIEEHNNHKLLQEQLDQKMKSSVSRFNKKMIKVDPKRVKKIHRFRILAKKLRYQGECLNSLTGSSRFDLDSLKNVQSIAGRIQNDSILLGTLDRFLAKKKHKDDPNALKIRKRLAINRAKLIKTDFSKLNALKWQN